MAFRPAYLSAENAARFRDRAVAEAYPFRLPYAPELFDALVALIRDEPRTVLDVGAGTGDLARNMAPRVDRVDAVDPSPAMIANGRTLPGGDHPRLRWIEGRAEDAPLDPPYALIVAGESLHWFDWDVALPRFASLLTANGLLAVVNRERHPAAWDDGLMTLIREYSTIRNWEDFDLIAEVERRGLFAVTGRFASSPIATRQTVADYAASFHSMSSLSREHLPPGAANAFDRRLAALVAPWSEHGLVSLTQISSAVWGRPLAG